MGLIEAIVRNPVKVIVGVLLIALFGMVAFDRMPMQLTPEVQRPTITVETSWPGASPQEVEREIVLEQEDYLKSVEGILKMESESADSKAKITLEFQVGTNMEEALLKVNSNLQQVPEYPENADQPTITTANSSDRPIAWFILSARHPSPEEFDAFLAEHPDMAEPLAPVLRAHNVGLAMLRLKNLAEEYPVVEQLLPPADLDVTKLRRFAEDEIEARFERVGGVSQSNVIGGLEDELQVIVDAEKLAARQLTILDVRRVLQGQNKDTSAGDFWEGKRRWVVRTLGQFDNIEDVENQVLAVRQGAPVYVRDVAEVKLGFKKPDGLVRRFGESSIAVNCIRETGANVLDVMDGLRAAREEVDENILKPRGLQLIQVYDETDYIYSSVNLVQQNIFIGGALTMVVLMLFLHLNIRTLILAPFILGAALAAAYLDPWYFAVSLVLILVAGLWYARGAFIVGLAIPTSIVGTFLVLGLLGRSLNVISLAGLAFAVGMLVDNAVVVLENIYRHAQMGESRFQAAIKGTHEVWGAVVASTLTTIAVFLPVVFIQEEAGQLFRDIALAISSAVGLSLIVSITLISTSSARLLNADSADAEDPLASPLPGGKRQKVNDHGSGILKVKKLSPVERFFFRCGNALIGLIVGLNRIVLGNTFLRIAVVLLLVGSSFGLSYMMWPKVEYLPTGNRNLVFGILLPPPGYNQDELMAMGQHVESTLRPYWDVDPGSPEAAKLDGPVIRDFFFVVRGKMVFLGVRAYDESRVKELARLIEKTGATIPDTFTVAKQASLFEQGLTGGRTIDVELIGPELTKLVQLGGIVIAGNGIDPAEGGIPGVMSLIPGAQPRPIPSLDLSSPEFHLTPRLLTSSDLGISSSDLGYTVDALIDGAFSGDYYIGGDKIDLTIIGSNQNVASAEDLASLSIATPTGRLVPLATVADVEMSSGPEQINHRERQRAITIEISPPAEVPLEDAMQTVQTQIVNQLYDNGLLGDGYRANLSGTADKLRETWNSLSFNVGLALLITYLLMAALFESWLYPFVIILSVPLGAVGGILGLQLLNLFVLQPLDVLTMLGFVILIGTVVNNPILIVHQSLVHIREDDMTPREAILESVRTRIRPIFMTTTTTLLGLLPLVIFPGSGSELYRGLGSVVLGGLLVSTIFTLFLVPVMFSLMMDLKAFIGGLIHGKKPNSPARRTPDDTLIHT
ncbi:efflux RND transporter permease subunit [Rubinisphaera brasiliensis]|uniref:Acriflavin resistance protein n=1 Tax=Rubinisphaera brasiliensis (strain ATCC 49424 / DSM 5305 / JCM 21570 / IAM 15109 / NBRC 103401 / IFAM 1448) TaxID=756272 RepID=F0SMV0_RUBBR|nr:efflux RND transporter permease subunit [Rubinisphaera brasiliensis]ADY59954.1 acriflavin resistance protein [Rubinisphaera brasiliensis DSM 5305]